ncbi:trypsin-like serine protease [Staphylococcus sp. IVB6214]|uniref:trypsin-like serine protease n=1 Tax=Staphylococcus sp. IVB6214 TaxID=2989766 RepID=UPI0021D3974C|nr:trypsin-like serine protease [Staphylococcus sp. IVB6214]UXR82442.1 trypsin-like serine protease [Staphylococcus sp. IVB6214]
MRKLNYIKIPLVLTGLYFVYPTQVAHANEVVETPQQNTTLHEYSQISQGKQAESEAATKPDDQTSYTDETQPSSIANKQQATADTYEAQAVEEDDSEDADETEESTDEPEENFTYDTSKDPNFDADGDLIDKRRKLTGDEVKHDTALVHTDNANYTGQIESLKGGDGTGAVIGKNLVLTAGHVLYNNNTPRDYMTGGYVIPGKDGDKEPYGRFKIKAMHVPEQYEETPWRKYDMGIIELEPNEKGQSIGDLIPPYRIKQFDRSMIGQKVYSQGYPADKNPVTQNQWHADGKIIQVQEQGTIEYSMHNSEGQSGGPVLLDKTREIIAVHTYGTRGNEYGTLGTPITSELYDWITSFIEKEPQSKPEEATPQDGASETVNPAPEQDETQSSEVQDESSEMENSSKKDMRTNDDKVLKDKPEENHVEQSVMSPVSSHTGHRVSETPINVANSDVKPVTTGMTPQFNPVSVQAVHVSNMENSQDTAVADNMKHQGQTMKKQLPQTGEMHTNRSFIAGFFLTVLGVMLLRFRRKVKGL